MASKFAREVRKESSQFELGRLQKEFYAWIDYRIAQDKRGQYQTQLLAIKSLISGAIPKVLEDLNRIDLEQSIGDVYEACHTIDLQILWLRRVWSFYKENLTSVMILPSGRFCRLPMKLYGVATTRSSSKPNRRN